MAILALSSASCDQSERKPSVSAPLERSQVVVASGTPAKAHPIAAAASPAATPQASAPAKAPKAFCAGQMERPGKSVARRPISQSVAAGEQALPAQLALSGAGYTWVNFWAAWCVPCKEEIPRLFRFQRELSNTGLKLSFVSLDDDERQLSAFLAEQPAKDGLRRTYWLKEGKEREDWLKAAGLEPDPELPFHLLFDAKGKLRCIVKGAVEDADLPAIRTALSR
jgi:thiol-disulfide isomerase/thioredoxin